MLLLDAYYLARLARAFFHPVLARFLLYDPRGQGFPLIFGEFEKLNQHKPCSLLY